MVKYNTSLRSRTIEESLVYARKYAEKYGISRVTNTVKLDNIGIPVYAGIRPNAVKGSLCVSAGKGLVPKEAEIGAYMEALELAFAEPHRQKVAICKAPIFAILDGAERPEAILDFCPKFNVEIPPDQELSCVWATDLYTQKKYLVPAELVFLPFPEKPKFFGSNSNGLSSGNSIADASLHGILEVIERDITSFQMIQENTYKVNSTSFPPNVAKIYQMVRKAGHDMILR